MAIDASHIEVKNYGMACQLCQSRQPQEEITDLKDACSIL